jgi:hypothetical protein
MNIPGGGRRLPGGTLAPVAGRDAAGADLQNQQKHLAVNIAITYYALIQGAVGDGRGVWGGDNLGGR